MTAPPLDRARLARVLALLGSPVDGEVIAAARAADRLVTAAGLTWPDVLGFGATDAADRCGAAVRDHRRIVDDCLAALDFLTDWEIRFLHGIRRQVRISERQYHILRQIADKAGIGRAA